MQALYRVSSISYAYRSVDGIHVEPPADKGHYKYLLHGTKILMTFDPRNNLNLQQDDNLLQRTKNVVLKMEKRRGFEATQNACPNFYINYTYGAMFY